MNPAEIQREPCQCHECIVAGVSKRPQRKDPHSAEWLHGKSLARWWQARDDFARKARAAVGERGRHASGFERLVNLTEDADV